MTRLSAGARIAIVAALAALAVALFIVLSDGDSDDDRGGETTAAQPTAERGASRATDAVIEKVLGVRDGTPVGGVQEITESKGERVRIRIAFVGAPPEEIHVHGYEITEPVRGDSLILDFKADLDGVFEIEAHTASEDQLLAELIVRP